MASKTIPSGFKFRPTDEEKMKYLANKVTGLGCDDDLIHTADLYGKQEPWEIVGAAGDNEEKELYFFTALKKVAGGNKKSGQRISRTVGQGFWSNKGQKDAVFGRKGGIIGYKRCFRYERKKGDDVDENNGKWLLKEYTLPDDNMMMKSRVIKEEYKDYALCVLKRKKLLGTCGKNNNDCPDVEIGLDDMLAYEPVPVPVPEPEPEEDWLQMIDWNDLANFDQANTWNDYELGDFTRRISQPCSVEEMLAGGDECLPPAHQSAPLIHM